MATIDMAQKLNSQVNLEFQASNLCLSLSEWCCQHDLPGSATFLRAQAQEKVNLMMRIFDFMKRAGAYPSVKALENPPESFNSLEELFQKAFEEYNVRREMLAQLSEEAKVVKDEKTLNFLRELDKAEQQDGLLLQLLIGEIHRSLRDGKNITQTDRALLNVVNCRKH
ncbi:non-heme ferritin-like protein [Pseudescherichia vulneris]|uniref:non-heme ferritin-like protein n=1 Tax=Pseudescherichia vulneris TaxID=566 RepID=UPI00227D1A7D|nr:non-heme ferritin-like protein [Pseudescherichia vulneris]WAH52409.1 non-heme ferritin-like protein [Pseudescherichia vulneris]